MSGSQIEITGKKQTVTSFNTLRVVATLLVIFWHVISNWAGDARYGEIFYSSSGLRMIFDSVILVVISRWSLPTFFMITGALLLNPEKNITFEKIRKYVLRMIYVLLTFGYAYCLIELISGSRTFSVIYLWTGLLNLLQGESWRHLWYLYTLIGLYLLLPILRKFVANSTEKEIVTVTLVLGILVVVIPSINDLTGLSFTAFDIVSYKGSVFYLLMGYILVHTGWADGLKKPLIWIAVAASAAILAILQVKGFREGHVSMYKQPEQLWNVVLSCAVFFFAVRSSWVAELGKNKLVNLLSDYSFGMYLTHMVCINVFYKMLHFFPSRLPAVVGEVMIWLCASVFAVVATMILKKVPGIKKLI